MGEGECGRSLRSRTLRWSHRCCCDLHCWRCLVHEGACLLPVHPGNSSGDRTQTTDLIYVSVHEKGLTTGSYRNHQRLPKTLSWLHSVRTHQQLVDKGCCNSMLCVLGFVIIEMKCKYICTAPQMSHM